MAKSRLFTYEEVMEAIGTIKKMGTFDSAVLRDVRGTVGLFGDYVLRHLIETPPKTDSSDAFDIVIQNSSSIFEMGPAESASGGASFSRVVIVTRDKNEKEIFRGVHFSEVKLKNRFKEKGTTSQLSK